MAEADVLTVTRVDIEPNDCPLQAPIAITMQFTLHKPIAGARWDVVYEADYTNKKQALLLHRSHPVDLAPGAQVFSHHVPEVRTDSIKEKYLLQVGLLRLTLSSATEEDIVSVNMVTQVSKDPATGALLRNIFNPLE